MADTTTAPAPASTAAAEASPTPPASTAAAVETTKHEATEVAKLEGGATETNFDSITDISELESILEGAHDPELAKKKPQDGKEVKATEAKAPETETTKLAPENTETETNLDEQGEFAKNYRFRTEDPRKQKLLTLIRQQPDANVSELAVQAGYPAPKAAAAATEVVQEQRQQEQVIQSDSRVEAAKQKVAELNAQLKEAEANFQSTAEITDKLLDAKIDLRQTEQEVKAEASAAVDFNSKAQAAEAEAVKLAPETAKPGTPQYEEIQREVAFLESKDDPILNRPDYALVVLKRVMTRRPELFPAAAKPVAAKVETTKTAPAARPTGQVESASSTAQPATLTSEQAAKQIDEMSLEDLQKIADATGEKRR